MASLKEKKLDSFIYKKLDQGIPIIGICLGMQLLGRSSMENEHTEGLNIISEDVFLDQESCHIGWNSTKCLKKNSLLKKFENYDFYFNHSYAF